MGNVFKMFVATDPHRFLFATYRTIDGTALVWADIGNKMPTILDQEWVDAQVGGGQLVQVSAADMLDRLHALSIERGVVTGMSLADVEAKFPGLAGVFMLLEKADEHGQVENIEDPANPIEETTDSDDDNTSNDDDQVVLYAFINSRLDFSDPDRPLWLVVSDGGAIMYRSGRDGEVKALYNPAGAPLMHIKASSDKALTPCSLEEVISFAAAFDPEGIRVSSALRESFNHVGVIDSYTTSNAA